MTAKPALKVEILGIEALIPYARNSRMHSPAQVAQIAASIREFGFTNPVLIDRDGGIIAGHGRVLAARQLQLQEVPCIRLSHLTEVQRRAYVILDNRLPLNAAWDEQLLALELNELQAADFDLKLLGFNTEELAAALDLGESFTPGTQEGQSQLDVMRSYTCPACNHVFTIAH